MARLSSQVTADVASTQHYDTVIVGSGFGSAFFLHEALRHARTGKVLLLEWGPIASHDEQVAAGKPSLVAPGSTFVNHSTRPWNFTIGFGGGTNCWFGQTPRFHPNDFAMKSRYGVGRDWPFGYDAMEPFYCEAEEIIAVSGDPDEAVVLPRSRPFPQPPHRLSTPDRILKQARPDMHFALPTARPRLATATRNACCASLRCSLCPADAKFTVNNTLIGTFEHPSVHVCAESRVIGLETQGGTVTAVRFENGGREYRVGGSLFVLGANAIHSPAILLRSGIDQGPVGKGLHESHGVEVEVLLDGIDNFDGSTITTGHDYGSYDGAFRRSAGSSLLHFENRWKFGLRTERGRWRQSLPIIINVEVLPDDDDRVQLDRNGAVEVVTGPTAAYEKAGADVAMERLPAILAALPVESIGKPQVRPTESHLQGTLRLGVDPADSVVDAGQVHHRLRNLVAVGTSVFPTCSAAAPSLTAAALSIRAARSILA